MMDLKSLALPPQTEEQRQKWTADFNEKQRIESEKQSDRVQKSWDESQNLFAQQQQNHKQMRIEEQVEAMRIIEAEKQQVNVDAGTEPKQKGKNEKRLDIINEWYVALCLKHQNDIELINQEIDGLTNEEIKTELANITLKEDKHIWVHGADRWIKDNGSKVWLFKRTRGGKSKKS